MNVELLNKAINWIKENPDHFSYDPEILHCEKLHSFSGVVELLVRDKDLYAVHEEFSLLETIKLFDQYKSSKANLEELVFGLDTLKDKLGLLLTPDLTVPAPIFTNELAAAALDIDPFTASLLFSRETITELELFASELNKREVVPF